MSPGESDVPMISDEYDIDAFFISGKPAVLMSFLTPGSQKPNSPLTGASMERDFQ